MPSYNLPPHNANVFLLSCMEDRLVQADANTVAEHGGGFAVRVAGGPLAILHPKHRATLLDQITIAQQVDPHGLIILRAHVGCGYAGLFSEFLGCDASSSPGQIFRQLEEVKAAVVAELGAAAEHISIQLEVVEPTPAAKVLKTDLQPVM